MKIYYEKLNAEVTPEALARLRKQKIVLESSDQSQLKGRYSIVIFDTYGSVTLDNETLEVVTNEQQKIINDNPYQALKVLVNDYKAEIDDSELAALPFISGFVGSCSFDLVRHEFPVLKQIELEDHLQHDAKFHMVEDVYVFDHYKEQLFIIATNLFSNQAESELKQRVQDRIDELKYITIYPEYKAHDLSNKQIEANMTQSEFEETVSAMKSLIQQGDMFQVVPSIIYSYRHQFGNHLQQLSYQLYQNLKRQNPSPYMYYLNMDEPIVVGSSPESFVKVKGDTVVTNPIAGTIKRGKNEAEDIENEKLLKNDEKELSEHSMLVDLGRNDIHRISATGTSKIEKLMAIERYEHVIHIVSEVTGKLNDDYSPMSVIASLLPTGTVSGAPKLRAIQRIYEAQPHKRGIYSGGIGYINCNHDLDFALAIRTMMIDDTHVNVQAGCGVVYDSIPEKEYEETRLKAKSLLEVSP
ncbi:anthranilate synthase component I [Staphylococcus gallinarum]|jgi:anthranilate synthase component 1|uniref:anthranilate synthase component I n=1 Tax=Staphylococcus gallinarum TaxID=1293 RepID=UPI000D1DE502|nr:anthranilate synthase component I [Staphylococcus gallinarum]MCD8820247.1 anthranilate synthase component I [Staphylococcus gallinarum]MEB6241929.1 anthranilate synthase component I [Staphylococcus gallinarum]MEB6295106.1 anthranilate synthase component I [Staphylococcus gallinarum]PTL06339.1 anthranilate synthase component I [Staphylococcus gallinarum]RIL30647.1 anthranilate synthase component I [Staphylococcus gallinarum]